MESVEQFLKFLSSRDQLGKDEIVDLAQQGYATAGQFGGQQQSTVTGATGHGSLAVDLFEEKGVAKFRVSNDSADRGGDHRGPGAHDEGPGRL